MRPSLDQSEFWRNCVNPLKRLTSPPPVSPRSSKKAQSTGSGRSKRCIHPCPICDSPDADSKSERDKNGTSKSSGTAGSSSPRRSQSPPSGPVRQGRVTKRWSKGMQRISKCKGLKNSGQTCYQNAVLQCLINVPEFVGYLDSIHNPKLRCPDQKIGNCVICALKSLVNSYADSDKKAVPDYERDKLQKVMQRTIPNNHPMGEDIKKDVQSDPFPFLQYLCEEMQERESSSAEGELTLDDLLKFAFTIEWKCETCGHLTGTKDLRANAGGGFGLSVNIVEPKPNLHIMDYLHHSEFTAQRLARCEDGACKEKKGETEGSERKFTKRVGKAPEILAIQMLRFVQEYNPKTKRADESKITSPVEFQEYLNLVGYTENAQPIIYQLQGVVGHRGRSPNGGHYIAAVREPNGKAFCTINDSQISKEHDGELEECELLSWDKDDFDKYLLFYTRV